MPAAERQPSPRAGLVLRDEYRPAVTLRLGRHLRDRVLQPPQGIAACCRPGERNHLYGNGAAGISASRLYASSISDNYIEDFNTSGITATVQNGAASVIMGNRIFKFSGHGTTFLNITQVNKGTGDLAVTGNVIRGTGTGTGLSYQRGAHQLTVTSTGNLVQNVATPRKVGTGVTLSTGY